VGEFATLLKSYGVSQIGGDRFANVWPVEVFAKIGVTYEQNAEPKSTLCTNMLPLLNSSASSCWTSRARSPSYAALSGAPRAAGATRSTILQPRRPDQCSGRRRGGMSQPVWRL
jgi:hypothetical protein